MEIANNIRGRISLLLMDSLILSLSLENRLDQFI
jgi:hypothetical protein